jgi:hypothetical protein
MHRGCALGIENLGFYSICFSHINFSKGNTRQVPQADQSHHLQGFELP